MTILTLTSDFGNRDYYPALLKGAILEQHRDLNIIDISHQIEPYNIVEAAFVLRNAYPAFPKGTIHLVSVDNFYNGQHSFVALQYDGHYFIAPDNGVLSLIIDEHSDYQVRALPYYPDTSAFPLKDTFAYAVEHIATHLPWNELGVARHEIVKRIALQPVVTQQMIRGIISYIDNYENVILNISQELFNRVRAGRPFSLYFKRHQPIQVLSQYYYDVPVGETLCRFNASDNLEIAVNMGRAASLLGLEVNDPVQVIFETLD